jgi:protein-S-isoprenylcysteine O-methyltransferase Ste14
MRATEFEFRYRFWIIAGLFFITFGCYAIDHVNSSQALLRAMGLRASGRPLHLLFGISAALAGLGALIRTWASAYLRSEIVHDSALHSGRVVADGPYRYLRNPLYLGNLLLAPAMGLVASRLGFVFIVVATFIFIFRLIGREESELLASQGDSYRAYYNAVPRLFPALTPRVPASGTRPQWGQAIVGETLFWVLFLAIVWIAVTFNGPGFEWICFGGIALYVVLLRVWKRKREAGATSPSASPPPA